MEQQQKTFRRIVTGHDVDGKAIIISDATPVRTQLVGVPGGPTFIEVWNTRETPVLIDQQSGEPGENGLVLAPPKGGTWIRVVEWLRCTGTGDRNIRLLWHRCRQYKNYINNSKTKIMKLQKLSSAHMAGVVLVFMNLSLIPVAGFSQQALSSKEADKPTIVLVHGAFADGSSWNKVIPILQKKGYQTIAVQNPLTSLSDDVAFVERIISEVKGNVILVGHSWGGVVITQAGNNEKVRSLVYVAAYAPDEGQSIESISKDAHEVRKIPNVPGLADPVVSDGFIRLKEETIINHFAQDLPRQEARIIAAGQGRFHVSTIAAKVSNPAWKNKPSFFIVADNDHIISPQVESEMAKNMHATTYHLPTSHVAMLSRPEKVAEVILTAAGDK
jgi:pimeloyl-ACP methyl ester carboxylesterase